MVLVNNPDRESTDRNTRAELDLVVGKEGERPWSLRLEERSPGYTFISQRLVSEGTGKSVSE